MPESFALSATLQARVRIAGKVETCPVYSDGAGISLVQVGDRFLLPANLPGFLWFESILGSCAAPPAPDSDTTETRINFF